LVAGADELEKEVLFVASEFVVDLGEVTLLAHFVQGRLQLLGAFGPLLVQRHPHYLVEIEIE